MLNKDGFIWSREADKAFEDLKVTITQPLVLSLPNFSKPFTMECDASSYGIDVVLIQEEKPITFLSEALKGKELSLSTYEKQLHAIVMAMQKWKPYLLGQTFQIKTD